MIGHRTLDFLIPGACLQIADMRIRIAHRTDYRYDPPASGVIQMLRLTPRNHDGQYVVRWRIDVSADARLAAHEDAFGNITHVFSADGPVSELCVEIDGEIETQSTDGVMRGTVERFGPSLFLRDTVLTQADQPIRDFAQTMLAEKGDDILAQLHGLLDWLHEKMTHDSEESKIPPPAAEAFTSKHGDARDLSHIFIGAAHSLSIPARYVAGYYRREDSAVTNTAGDAWAEAFVPGLGWVAFDPARGFCPTDAHVRVAIGLDCLGAAPVRRMNYGPGAESLAVAVKVGQ
jgi:transglutaminase-like putative cysteine protease